MSKQKGAFGTDGVKGESVWEEPCWTGFPLLKRCVLQREAFSLRKKGLKGSKFPSYSIHLHICVYIYMSTYIYIHINRLGYISERVNARLRCVWKRFPRGTPLHGHPPLYDYSRSRAAK